jgi:hypothetical protein
VIASISPLSMTAGSSDLTLTITGSNFAGPPCLKCDAYSLALWSANGTDVRLTTTFVDSGELTAIIPAALLTGPVTAEVFVQTWAGAQSDNDHVVAATSAFAFTVTP